MPTLIDIARKEYQTECRAFAHREARAAPVPRKKPEAKKLEPIEIVRDEYWNKLYEAARVDKFSEEDAAKFADSGVKCRIRSLKIKAEKQKRYPPLLAKPPPMTDQPVNVHKRSEIKCQSRTLENRPCPFRATSKCGRFCSKHTAVFTLCKEPEVKPQPVSEAEEQRAKMRAWALSKMESVKKAIAAKRAEHQS